VNSVTPGYPAGDLRVSDADRDRAISDLTEHFQAGRLTADEFDERSSQALQSRTGTQLSALFADLPPGRAAITSPPSPGPVPAARIGLAAPVLLGILASLAVFSFSQAGMPRHLHVTVLGPNFHPLVLILVVLFVSACLSRRRHRRDRRWDQGPGGPEGTPGRE
jgi:Domain of unknown function (DUF1707)